MKKIFSKLVYLVTFLVMSSLLQACFSGSESSGTIGGPNKPRSSGVLDATSIGGLQYFGWMHDSSDGIGTGNYMDEIAGHSNFTFIYGNSPNQNGSREVDKLKQARSRGLKAVLAVGGVFFNSGYKLMLDSSEYNDRWRQYADNVTPYASDILAFYLDDEPELTIFNQDIHDKAVAQGLIPKTMTMNDHWSQFVNNANTAANIIHARFPTAKVIMNFSATAAQMNLNLPANFDWLGMYCYGPWDNCMTMGESFPSLYAKFKAHLQPNQKIFLIPEATDFYYLWTGTPMDTQGIVARVNNYIQLAQSDSRIVAFMPFIWQSLGGSDLTKGAREMPSIRDAWVQVGLTVTRGAPAPTPGPSPSPSPSGKTLASNERLLPGEHIVSPNGQNILVYQGDGNLVLYSNGNAIFSTGTFGSPGQAVMQGDGNFVIYKNTGAVDYSAGTNGHPGAYLAVEDSGRIAIYSSSNAVLWFKPSGSPTPAPGPAPGPTPAPTPTPNPSPAPAPTGSVTLNPGQNLLNGQSLLSPNGRYQFVYQGDGNLVLYDLVKKTATWASKTFHVPGFVAMQGDGNLVIYDNRGLPTFSTKTNGNPGAYFALQDDGKIVIKKSNGSVLWTKP